MSDKSKNKRHDTLTLKPSETAEAIRVMQKTNRSLFIWGPPGIAKSAVAAQVATGLGIAFIDVRLSQMEPTDLRGIPYPTKVGGVEGVRWSVPYVMPKNLDFSFLVDFPDPEALVVHFGNPKGSNGIHYCTDPKVSLSVIGHEHLTAYVSDQQLDRLTVGIYDTDALNNYLAAPDSTRLPSPHTGKVRVTITGDAKAILGLEEFNSAPSTVQAASYQLVHDRRLGEYEVPDGVMLTAMGNRETDKGVTYRMATPVSNRFDHIEMAHNFDDWFLWAVEDRVNADVLGYVSAFKDELFQFDPNSASRAFATPRTWHMVSDIMNLDEDMSPMVALALVCGCVGDASGIKFMDFRKVAKNLPRCEDILSGKITKMPSDIKKDVSLAVTLSTSLCYELKDRVNAFNRIQDKKDQNTAKDAWAKEADNFLAFIMENFSPEVNIMATRTALKFMLPFDAKRMKNFLRFAKEYQDFIL